MLSINVLKSYVIQVLSIKRMKYKVNTNFEHMQKVIFPSQIIRRFMYFTRIKNVV